MSHNSNPLLQKGVQASYQVHLGRREEKGKGGGFIRHTPIPCPTMEVEGEKCFNGFYNSLRFFFYLDAIPTSAREALNESSEIKMGWNIHKPTKVDVPNHNLITYLNQAPLCE